MSLHSICFMGATSISNFAAGTIAQFFGVANTFIIFGSVMLLTAIIFITIFYRLEFVSRL